MKNVHVFILNVIGGNKRKAEAHAGKFQWKHQHRFCEKFSTFWAIRFQFQDFTQQTIFMQSWNIKSEARLKSQKKFPGIFHAFQQTSFSNFNISIFFFHFYLLSENYNESYAITYLTYGLTTVYIIQEILKSKGPIQSKDLT